MRHVDGAQGLSQIQLMHVHGVGNRSTEIFHQGVGGAEAQSLSPFWLGIWLIILRCRFIHLELDLTMRGPVEDFGEPALTAR